MQEGANTTYVRYEVARGLSGGVEFEIKVLVNHRNFHDTTQAGAWQMEIVPAEHGLRLLASSPQATPFYLLSDTARAQPQQEWYRNFDLAEERRRGLDDHEDHLLAAIFQARLEPHQSLTLVFSTDPTPILNGAGALGSEMLLEEKLVEHWVAAHPQASLGAPRGFANWCYRRPSFRCSATLAGESFGSQLDHRRVPLVWRLGTRHDDRTAWRGS